jgi:lipopolysaccharide biosynthesis protein
MDASRDQMSRHVQLPVQASRADREAARVIAFYLPQYHPIPENDEWWGKGFTEWTNTAKAKPLFRGHYQPHIPADLGFYDLRVPETRAAQADLARQYGVTAFCYYHYWFAGKRIIERPFNEVLASGQPDFPFCLCWANQTWTGVWHGAAGRILIEQTYPGMDDHARHFETLLPAFLDRRYLRVDGKPIFVIFIPEELPDSRAVLDDWRTRAVKAGLPGLFLIAHRHWTNDDPKPLGYDASLLIRFPPRRRESIPWSQPLRKIVAKHQQLRGRPTIHSYERAAANAIRLDRQGDDECFPCVIPNWDNTARSGANGLVFHGSTPALFRVHFREALERVRQAPPEHRLVFVKAWNEWAEGNHLEPDLKFGHQYLEVIRDELRVHGTSNTMAPLEPVTVS